MFEDNPPILEPMDLKHRIELAMARKNMSAGTLIKLTGASKAAVYWWLDGTTKELKGKNLLRAAKALDVRPQWLGEGRGPMIESEDHANITEIAYTLQRVPLISWVQAGDFGTVVDNYAPGEAEEWVETTLLVRQHTFALRIKGDSMEDEFKDGAIIIIEPDLEPHPGDFVVVRANSDTECTFKQLIKDGKDLYLKPLNPRYPIKPMPEDAAIIGVVRDQIRRYR